MKSIQYLFEAYFHQDWDAEHDTPRDVLIAFCDSENSELCLALVDELNAILLKGDAEISAILCSQEIYYDYDIDFKSDRDWLHWIISVVTDRLREG